MAGAQRSTFIVWSPRITALTVSAFLSVFALDAFSEGSGFLVAIAYFLLHLTPTFAMIGVVYLAWRRPWLGALVFLGLAVVYAMTTLDHPRWIAAIAGPLTLTGVLYLFSWRSAASRPGDRQ